jgi:hypothetical protein
VVQQVPVPAQHCLRLQDHQRLFPNPQSACQQHKEGSVAPSQRWTLRLSFQYNELPPQEHVFQQQFRVGACQIQRSIQDWNMVVRLCPPTETLFGCLADRFYAEDQAHAVHFSVAPNPSGMQV